MTPFNRSHTIVLSLQATPLGEERYFVRFGRAGQVITAWSITGATRFGPWETGAMDDVGQRLIAKGYRVTKWAMEVVKVSP